MRNTTRRSFLRTAAYGSAVLTFGTAVPDFLRAATRMSRADGRRLVVIELAGGNDGLNSIVPFQEPVYRELRPKLAVPEADVLKIDEHLGFHPSLRGFADLLESGRLAVVQGVGYEQPNRSHFESMDIWHTCQRKEDTRTSGWLGRYLDVGASTAGSDPRAIHLGHDKQPFALMSRAVRVPSIRSLDEFRIQGGDDQAFRQVIQELAEARRNPEDGLLDFIQSSTSSAIAASERVTSAGHNYSAAATYPETELAQKLLTVARLIDAELATTVYYLQIDGFDTHSQQAGAHNSLLRQVAESVRSFLDDVTAHGHADQVAVMCFSEFGRRVAENASEGTDHGTAGPMFVAGTAVRPGLIGAHPSLDDLQDGDLKHHTDFRQVYAAVLEQWLQCETAPILLGQYNPVPVFA